MSRLRVLVALGAAAMAATAGAAVGWRYAPDLTSGHMARVKTTMPTGSPVYVMPECTLTSSNTLKNADGSTPDHIGGPGGPVPPGFTPLRAVRCGAYGDDKSMTQTQAEVRDPSALAALVAAYRTESVLEFQGPMWICAAYADLGPAIALVDAHGTAIWPAAPRDSCGHVIVAVKKATGGDKWIVTKSVTTPF
jgi:hypothetical protein